MGQREPAGAWAGVGRLRLERNTVVPALLEQLALHGCIVTVDTLHCQVKTAETIVRKEADYMIIAKGNQQTLHNTIWVAFAEGYAGTFVGLAPDQHQTEETNHGRWKRRTYRTLLDPAVLAQVNPTGHRPKLSCIGLVHAERQVNGKTSVEDRYDISSLDGNAHMLFFTMRGHWGIEHFVHWILDLVFYENECRVSVGKEAERLAVLRHIALNLLQQDRSSRQSMKQKRFRAALKPNYLLRLLNHAQT